MMEYFKGLLKCLEKCNQAGPPAFLHSQLRSFIPQLGLEPLSSVKPHLTGYDSHNLSHIAIYSMGPIRVVVCGDSRMWSTQCYRVSGPEQTVCAPRLAWHSVKPDFFCPNVKHIFTVWIVPYPLYIALRAIHRAENTNTMNKWLISAGASACIYSEGGGSFGF